MEKSPPVGKMSDTFFELTKMVKVLMSPGRACDVVSALYTQTSVSDYEKFCGTEKNITIVMNLCLRNS